MNNDFSIWIRMSKLSISFFKKLCRLLFDWNIENKTIFTIWIVKFVIQIFSRNDVYQYILNINWIKQTYVKIRRFKQVKIMWWNVIYLFIEKKHTLCNYWILKIILWVWNKLITIFSIEYWNHYFDIRSKHQKNFLFQ